MKRASALLCALVLAGCETSSYYAQAVGGHMDLRNRARPVRELLADPQAPADLRELVRPYAGWNVVVAGEFALEAVESCFPVAGCVTYRGYYSKEDAERDAAHA